MQVRIAASLASWRARCAPHTHARRERGEIDDKHRKYEVPRDTGSLVA